MTLIEKLEQATEGSRELDAEIFWTADRNAAERVYWNAAFGKPHKLSDDFSAVIGIGRSGVKAYAPHYTTSVDAALRLVPEGFCGQIEFDDIAENDAWVMLANEKHSAQATSQTIALALCIAALKAREL